MAKDEFRRVRSQFSDFAQYDSGYRLLHVNRPIGQGLLPFRMSPDQVRTVSDHRLVRDERVVANLQDARLVHTRLVRRHEDGQDFIGKLIGVGQNDPEVPIRVDSRQWTGGTIGIATLHGATWSSEASLARLAPMICSI